MSTLIKMRGLLLFVLQFTWLAEGFHLVHRHSVPLRGTRGCLGRQGRMIAMQEDTIRVNKALRATHSRREADRLVADGCVTVNGVVAQAGQMLTRGDSVRLDGMPVDWERLNPTESGKANFVYLKLWKARGVVCTTDRRVRKNIVDALGDVPGVDDRIYPIGRLDADSTGLILLTSDGSIVNGLLRSSERKRKEYLVSTDRRATDDQIARLSAGVTITTVAQRDGRSKALTAPTRPCVVERAATPADGHQLRFVLEEGRNRQIRRMCEACGLQVVRLHRVSFAGITLDGCQRPGQWTFLNEEEVERCRAASLGVPAATSPPTSNPAEAAVARGPRAGASSAWGKQRRDDGSGPREGAGSATARTGRGRGPVRGGGRAAAGRGQSRSRGSSRGTAPGSVGLAPRRW